MFEVCVTERFAARHQLPLPDGDWEPLHAHDWRVTVTFAGPLLGAGDVLIDFEAVQRRLRAALAPLTATILNELPQFAGGSPSAERVAAHLGQRLAAGWPPAVRLTCVEVEEAPGCVARCYLPSG
jgi:6-pyruvoyl-tetrahydropterin synthase